MLRKRAVVHKKFKYIKLNSKHYLIDWCGSFLPRKYKSSVVPTGSNELFFLPHSFFCEVKLRWDTSVVCYKGIFKLDYLNLN